MPEIQQTPQGDMPRPRKPGFFYLISPVLIYFVISYVIQMLMTMIIMVMRFMPEVLERSFQGEDPMLIVNNLTPRVFDVVMSYALPMTAVSSLVCILYGVWQFHKDARPKPEPIAIPVHALNIVFMAMAVIVLNVLLVLLQTAFPNLGRTWVELSENAIMSASLFWQILVVVIIAPIAEEFIFRGLLFKRMRDRMDFPAAMLFSSFIFGAIHGNMIQFIYASILGMMMAWLYERYQSLWLPMIFHVLANLFSLLMSHTPILNWMFYSDLVLIVSVGGFAAIGAMSFISLRHRSMKNQAL